MFEKKFLEATLERAVKTFVQTLLALLGTDAAGVLTVDILAAVQVAGASALLSVLTSLGSSKVGDASPSLVGPAAEAVSPVETVAVKAVATKKTAKKSIKK